MFSESECDPTIAGHNRRNTQSRRRRVAHCVNVLSGLGLVRNKSGQKLSYIQLRAPDDLLVERREPQGHNLPGRSTYRGVHDDGDRYARDQKDLQ